MKTDVAIIGAGPGGTSAAMFLRRLGIRCTLVERARFPRYHIGESMTGECGGVVRALGLEEKMTSSCYPVKQGVKVIGPSGKNSFFVPVMARSPEGALVEACTWQVRRSEFDLMMLNEATSRGADLLDGEVVAPVVEDGAVRGLQVRTPGGGNLRIDSEVVIDASGQGTFLSRFGLTSSKDRGRYDKQVAVFSQVAGAVRDPGKHHNDTLIFYQKKFHWAWFIPLDRDVVSVGVVVPVDYFMDRKESKHDFLCRELRELNPDLTARIPEMRFTEEVRAIPNYSYHVDQFTGKGFICIGDAHRFIDPIFSFGLFFTMREAQFAASAIGAYFEGARRDDPNPFAPHQQLCERGMDVLQEVIDAFWEEPFAFALAVHQFHRDDCIDMFAGRVYAETPSAGLRTFQKINAGLRKAGQATPSGVRSALESPI